MIGAILLAIWTNYAEEVGHVYVGDDKYELVRK